MSVLNDIANSLGGLIRDYSSYFSMSIVATLLVIYGNEINEFIKNSVKSLHFFARVMVFILVSAFAYGLATVLLSDLLDVIFQKLSNVALIPVMFASFIVIGLLAEHKKQV